MLIIYYLFSMININILIHDYKRKKSAIYLYYRLSVWIRTLADLSSPSSMQSMWVMLIIMQLELDLSPWITLGFRVKLCYA